MKETAEKWVVVSFLRVVTWSYFPACSSSCLYFAFFSCLWCSWTLPSHGHPTALISPQERGTGQEAELGWRELVQKSLWAVLRLSLILSMREELTWVLLVHDKAAFDVKEQISPAPSPASPGLCKSAETSGDRLLMCGVWVNAEQPDRSLTAERDPQKPWPFWKTVAQHIQQG